MRNNLRNYRKIKGLTQQELANVIGVTRITIINIEQGKYVHVHKAVLKKLCEYFNTTPVYILGTANLICKPQNVSEYEWLINELQEEMKKLEIKKEEN